MATTTPLTDQEFLNLPDEPGKDELLDGELLHMPPAKYSHNRLAMWFVDKLRTVLDPNRVHMEQAYRLRPRRWLIPDVSVSWPDLRIEDDYLQAAPMLAIEIASESDTSQQVERKVNMYLADGSAEVWVIYPKLQSTIVSRPDTLIRVAPDANYRCELFGKPLIITPQDRTA